MKEIHFKALDYTSDDTFIESDYIYKGDEKQGWKIIRNGSPYLELGKGYRLLKTKSCGVCSTDIDRRFLPFPLPQVIGHEVIAEDPDTHQNYVVEINDTFEARGDSEVDSFVREGIPTHSPERKVLGIDRLPGGFGAYILAPVHAAIPYNNLDEKAAVLIEPFAASLQAVIASPPEDGDIVAVLGPRRLGSLVIAALHAYRLDSKKKFKIVALARRQKLLDLAIRLGADEGINISESNTIDSLENHFDILYDTTSTTDGFQSAIRLAKRELHLKTTNGQKMGGLRHLTELVVDELSILPFSLENLHFHWAKEKRENLNIFLCPSFQEIPKEDMVRWISIIRNELSQFGEVSLTLSSFEEAHTKLDEIDRDGKFPRFDIAIATKLEEIDSCIRPIQGKEDSLVRPRGAILYLPQELNLESSDKEYYAMNDFFLKGKSIRTSRCGDFHLAIKLLNENPIVTKSLADNMISHTFDAKELRNAFATAKTTEAIKVMVQHA